MGSGNDLRGLPPRSVLGGGSLRKGFLLLSLRERRLFEEVAVFTIFFLKGAQKSFPFMSSYPSYLLSFLTACLLSFRTAARTFVVVFYSGWGMLWLL